MLIIAVPIGLQALGSEQQRRRKVVIHRFVVVEMVRREIGQNRGVELKTILSALMEAVARDLSVPTSGGQSSNRIHVRSLGSLM